ncbi:MAG: MFS transporter [Planctomycetales bacterium]
MRVPCRFLFIAATFALSVLLYIDRICISAAKEDIARDLHLSNEQMGFVLSTFALGYALFQTPSGWLADRFGPRGVLTGIVVFWSFFTGLTAAAGNLVVLLLTRFLFGAGEAGAFPGIARATYSWIPLKERGILQGINFSGSRVGGALALVVMPGLIQTCGWRGSFVLLMVIGFAWAAVWLWWFRDDPMQHRGISPEELNYILAHRQPEIRSSENPLSAKVLLSPGEMRQLGWISLQYFCSNFTFFFCLTWLFPHLKEKYQLSGVEAGWYSAVPLICAAFANWTSGWMVDRIYQSGRWTLSRRIPAIIGFVLAAVGLVVSATAQTPLASIVWFSLAVFGADMTISPSWACCIDLGGKKSGVISGTMNMAGNLGSFLTSLAFPYLLKWTGSNLPYFYIGAGLNVLAVLLWLKIDPRPKLEASP